MKAHIFTNDERLITKAVDVLIKELGPVEAIRFLALLKKKQTESVKRHHQGQAELQKPKFFNRVFGARAKGAMRK